MRILFMMCSGVLLVAGYMLYVSFAAGDFETEGVTIDVALPTSDVQEKQPVQASVVLVPDMSREEIVTAIGAALSIDTDIVTQLYGTYRLMQWDAFNEKVVEHLVDEYELTDEDREVVLTHATILLEFTPDILESLYIPGTYAIDSDMTPVDIASILIDPVPLDRVPSLISASTTEAVLTYVRNEQLQLPDLVPLPPQDVALRSEGGRTLLAFSTIYYNAGRGNLELRADPSTIGVLGDFERDVFQRIYRDDGTYDERLSGRFEWHNEHLHYHFSDFALYRLEAVDSPGVVVGKDIAQKSTFCVRDVSRVYITGVSSSTEADYKICGRERQGVTVGWGDAYFSTYADQNLDVTTLPSGTYRLFIIINPERRFDEITLENNVAYATIVYDREQGAVRVLTTSPASLPRFEHIHIEQEL